VILKEMGGDIYTLNYESLVYNEILYPNLIMVIDINLKFITEKKHEA